MKRKQGDGSFRQLKNGTFEFTVSCGFDLYGKLIRKRFYGTTETECRKKYKEFIKSGDKPTPNKEHSLAEWLDIWLDKYKSKNVQSSTYEEYVHLCAHIKKHQIGSLKLSKIKPIHITDFFTDMINYSHSVRKRIRFLLHGALEAAIDNDYINRNPVDRAEIAKKKQGEKEAFTEDEVRTILNFAKQDELFGLPMLIMLNTGIRSGEIRALSPDKIDTDKCVIKIDKAVKKDGEIGCPKNGKSRYVPIKKDFADYLKRHLEFNVNYVVGNNFIVSESSFRSRYLHFFGRLNKILINTGETAINPKSPHATRHTYGTLLQKNGMPIAMVSELLGHSSTDVTDKYTHLNDISILSSAIEKYLA